MNLNPVDETPSAVFKRLDINAEKATHFFFIGKRYRITFGNSCRTSAGPAAIAVVRNTSKNSWKITNEGNYNQNVFTNGGQLFVNQKLLGNKCTLSLKSGDKVRFKSADFNLTYSFEVYSKDDPPTPFVMKCYLNHNLKALEAKTDVVNQNCIKLNSELDKLKHVKNNTEVVYPKGVIPSTCKIPLGAFNLISSNVTAPVYYFFYNIVTTFGKSPVCDIVIKSDVCSPVEATVKKSTKWQITNDAEHLLFVNDRYFENGETLNLKSGDRIRFGMNEKIKLIYKFQLYSDGISFPSKHEARKFLETEFNKLKGKVYEMNQSCNQLKTKLKNLYAKIESERTERLTAVLWRYETNSKINTPSNFASVNDSKNGAKKKKDETYERSKKIKLESEGSKDIKNKLINKCSTDKIDKCESVCTSKAKIETKPFDVFKSESKTCENAAATEVKLKVETKSETPAIMYDEAYVSSDLKIKTELVFEAFEIDSRAKASGVKCEKINATEVKIKREPIEVNETKIETLAAIYKEVVSGDLKIKAELLEGFEFESKTVKCEKVNANELKIKKEPVGVIETKSKKSEVKCEKVNATEMKIKRELVKGIETISKTSGVMYQEGFSSNLKIKTELTEAFEIKGKTVKSEKVNAIEVKVKKEPVEVIEIDCD